MSRPTDIDIVVRQQTGDQPMAVASVLFQPALAAAAHSADEAVARLEETLTSVAARDPQRLQPAPEQPPETEQLELELPAPAASGFERLTVSLTAVVQRERVSLPELPLTFPLDDRDHLPDAAAEYLRLALPPDRRLDAIVPLPDADNRTLHTDRLSVTIENEGADARAPSTTALAQIGDPLHEVLDRKDAPGAFHRDDAVDALVRSLASDRERSAVLIGPGGVGKTAVVYEAVGRIIDDEVPVRLRDTPVWRIRGGRLSAAGGVAGDWKQLLVDALDELQASSGILFVDNLVDLLAATGTDGGDGAGAAGLLLPELEAGNISLVGELRPEQVGLIDERHPSFLQTLRPLRMSPMSTAETDDVLERVSYRLGRQHGVRLADETRERIIGLVERFYGTGGLPGPAVDLAERLARTHKTESVEREGEARPLLLPEHAVEAMAGETGMPTALLDPDTAFSVDDVRSHFTEAVFDQPAASEAMTDLVTILRAGLNPPERPMGSYLFVGPTGVGKTQTALALAEYLFGDEDRLLRFDMSEYQDRPSAARLVGRTRGEAGQLVRRVREQPFRVLLLDELEKAHAQVFDMLLQVLDEGRLTDGLGQTVNLTNTVIVMTSNLGASSDDPAGPDDADDPDNRYVRAAEDHFRPEFIGRLDRIVPFQLLGEKTARRLVRRTLDEAFTREGIAGRNLDIQVADEVVTHLADTGFDDRYGARPLRQTVESEVTARLADHLSRHPDLADTTLRVILEDGEPVIEG
jgi:ATP-dependent Clp protease ATP-binding subunit ClpC